MSRLTGTDAMGLVEAYNAVYTPQELSEEQIWEEVESWVNSLLEEGYDLSEYTWEEIYEEYLSEMGGRGQITTGQSQAPYQSRFARPMNAGTPQTYGGGRSRQVTVRPQIGSIPSSSRQVPQYPQGVSTGVGGGNAGASRTAPGASIPTPRPAAAPAAAAPRPSIAAPAAAAPRPAAAAPRPAAAPAAATKPTPTSPTRSGFGASAKGLPLAGMGGGTSTGPSVSSQVSDLRAMRARSLERQGKPTTQMSHADLYDIVKGHLLDEGYADTEESALSIMSNMSEEWLYSIVEENLFEKLKPGTRGKISFATGKQDFDQKMTEKNPKTGRQRATSPELKAMGAHARARTAQERATQSGDHEAAAIHKKRRGDIAHVVYRKTGRLLDYRADND